MIKHWYHIIVNARCTWLHGDPRGFRSRWHRIHSSGDYKNRPPKSEHAGLHRWHVERSHEPVRFEEHIRIEVVRAFVQKCESLEHRIIACSCGAEHVHSLIEVSGDYAEVRKEVGKMKQKVSHALRDVLPGAIWASGGQYKRIVDVKHLHATYAYIRHKQEHGAVVWSHRDEENWIADETQGVIFMSRGHKRIRVFGVPQTPGV